MNIFKVWGEVALRGAEQVRAKLGGIDQLAQNAGKKMAQTGQHFVNAGQQFVGAGQKMTATGATLTAGVTAPIAGIGLKSITAGMDFANAMSKVQALSGAAGKDLQSLEDTAKKMGRETSFSATQAADAFGFMALAGWDTNQMLNAINPVLDLAKAGSMDLAQASDIVTDTMSMFKIQAEEAGHATDVFAFAQSNANTNVEQMGEAMKYAGASAASLGMSIEETSSFMMAFANQGIKGSMAGTTMEAMLRDLTARAEDGKLAINGMNIELYDQEGNFRGLLPVMQEIEQATADLSDEEKRNVLSKYFQQEALRGVNLSLNEGMDKISGYNDSLSNNADAQKKAAGAANEAAKIMGENTKGAYDELLSKIEAVSIAFAQTMEPAVIWVTEKLGDLATWLENTDEKTKLMIVGIAGFAAALGPVILYLGMLTTSFGHLLTAGGKLIQFFTLVNGTTGLTKFGSLLMGLKKAFTAAIWGIRAFSTALFTTPVGWIILGITAIIAAIYLLWDNWDTVSAWLSEAWEWLKELAMSIFEPIANFISETWTAIKTKTVEIWNAVMDFLREWGTTILAVFGGPIGLILALVIEHWDAIKEVTIAVWNAVKSWLASVWNAIVSVVKPPILAIYNYLKARWDAAKAVTQAVWNAVKSFMAAAWEWIKQKVITPLMAIYNQIKSRFNQVKSTITSVMNNVKTLISNAWNNIKKVISLAVDFVLDAVKTGFKLVRSIIQGDMDGAYKIIKGFSDKWKSAGKGLLEAFTKGIKNGFKKAKDAVTNGLKKIRNLLPFSPAKEGPLSDLDKSGESFFPTFASRMLSQKGLGKGVATVHKGMNGIYDALETEVNPSLRPAWATVNPSLRSHIGEAQGVGSPTNVYITVHGNLDSELYDRLMRQQAQDTKNAFYIRGLRG
ncbi:phage tail tape measure protein [Desmospora activa]|uniref:TP901 family phage tail tape measure protein n=1 Tax=Desmospora activa DSM 45169 TaxID=1121389 RepID=A0A2T4Z920_9BACL|nr:phage tail tape measure protein [Desmospora activa]PTM58384.1 TP901 family phage tail tape measure protein [Desmospora activa DSM 45169]